MNYGFLVMGCGLATLAGIWLYDVLEGRTLRRLVWQNLDAAHEGGQFDPDPAEGGSLAGMNTFDVCNDMMLYCEDVFGYSEEQLWPHVHAWMVQKGFAS